MRVEFVPCFCKEKNVFIFGLFCGRFMHFIFVQLPVLFKNKLKKKIICLLLLYLTSHGLQYLIQKYKSDETKVFSWNLFVMNPFLTSVWLTVHAWWKEHAAVTRAQKNNDNMSGCTVSRLSRGPTHLAPTQDMQMDVVDRLAAVWSIIDDNPIAVFQASIFSQLLCNQRQVAQQLADRMNWLDKV